MNTPELDDKRMSFVEHLDELRKRLIICTISISVASCIAYAFVKPILKLITQPVGKQLVFIAPQEAFFTYLIAAIFCGIFLASPVVLFEIWRFVSTALTRKERKYILIYAPLSFLLFVGGLTFAFVVALPLGDRYLSPVEGGRKRWKMADPGDIRYLRKILG